MPEALTNISPAALAGLIVAYLLAASRIAGPLTDAWASLPKPWAAIIPAIVSLLPQVADVFSDVNTWQSFAVSVSSAIALILPGIKPKPPGPPSEKAVGQVDAGPWNDSTPPSLPGVRMKWVNVAWMCLLLPGCGLFTAATAKTAQDIAHDLCVLHYGKEKPALSIDDVARTYCKDIDPWLDVLVGAEKLGAAKAEAKRPAP